MKGESFQIVSWFQSWSSRTGLVACAGETIHKSNHAAATPKLRTEARKVWEGQFRETKTWPTVDTDPAYVFFFGLGGI